MKRNSFMVLGLGLGAVLSVAAGCVMPSESDDDIALDEDILETDEIAPGDQDEPNVVSVGTWHVGSWGATVDNGTGSCTFTFNGQRCNGTVSADSQGRATAWFSSCNYGNPSNAQIQVRGRTFSWNSWGQGTWVNYGYTSRHDCGTLGCGQGACRIKIFGS